MLLALLNDSILFVLLIPISFHRLAQPSITTNIFIALVKMHLLLPKYVPYHCLIPSLVTHICMDKSNLVYCDYYR